MFDEPTDRNIVFMLARRDQSREMNDEDEDYEDDDEVVEDTDEATIYIVEGGQIGYGDKRAWEACRDC